MKPSAYIEYLKTLVSEDIVVKTVYDDGEIKGATKDLTKRDIALIGALPSVKLDPNEDAQICKFPIVLFVLKNGTNKMSQSEVIEQMDTCWDVVKEIVEKLKSPSCGYKVKGPLEIDPEYHLSSSNGFSISYLIERYEL